MTAASRADGGSRTSGWRAMGQCHAATPTLTGEWVRGCARVSTGTTTSTGKCTRARTCACERARAPSQTRPQLVADALLPVVELTTPLATEAQPQRTQRKAASCVREATATQLGAGAPLDHARFSAEVVPLDALVRDAPGATKVVAPSPRALVAHLITSTVAGQGAGLGAPRMPVVRAPPSTPGPPVVAEAPPRVGKSST